MEGIITLAEGKPRTCSLRSSLAYFDGDQNPACFSSQIDGELSPSSKGQPQEYHWSKLFHIFIPRNETKTLAEMTRPEYEKWRSEINKEGIATYFGQWYSSK